MYTSMDEVDKITNYKTYELHFMVPRGGVRTRGKVAGGKTKT